MEPIALDDISFDDSFASLYAVAYRVAFRIVGSREEATDIAQESLARAAQHWDKVKDHAAPWVATVAGHQAVGYWRTRKRRDAYQHRLQSRSPDPFSDPLRAERLDLVRALRALPKRQREVVVLRYLADRSEAEVAAILGCSEGTVKSAAHRGLSALRDAVGAADSSGGI
jgi:RNA polymerase sigma-70 factor (sigma-E family)